MAARVRVGTDSAGAEARLKTGAIAKSRAIARACAAAKGLALLKAGTVAESRAITAWGAILDWRGLLRLPPHMSWHAECLRAGVHLLLQTQCLEVLVREAELLRGLAHSLCKGLALGKAKLRTKLFNLLLHVCLPALAAGLAELRGRCIHHERPKMHHRRCRPHSRRRHGSQEGQHFIGWKGGDRCTKACNPASLHLAVIFINVATCHDGST